MTVDERILALTERHEALSQTVELVAGMQKANEVALRKMETNIEKLSEYMAGMMQAIQRMANTTSVHILQIDDLAARVARLEQGSK